MRSLDKAVFPTYESMAFLLMENYVMIILTFPHGIHFVHERMTGCSERSVASIEDRGLN